MNSSLIGIYSLKVQDDKEAPLRGEQATAVGTLRLFKDARDHSTLVSHSASHNLLEAADLNSLSLGLKKVDGGGNGNDVGVEDHGDSDICKKSGENASLTANDDHSTAAAKLGNFNYQSVLLYSNNLASFQPHDPDPNTTIAQQDQKGRNTILLLSIPSYQTPQDFLLLMGGVFRKDLLHVRLLFEQDPQKSDAVSQNKRKEDTHTNQRKPGQRSKSTRFMMLFKFKSTRVADAFYSEFNGKLFTSFENDICHLVWIDMIILMMERDVIDERIDAGLGAEREEMLQLLFPSTPSAPSSLPPSPTINTIKNQIQDFDCIEEVVLDTTDESSKSAFPAPSQLTRPSLLKSNIWVEMPTCPVCLDRLDSSVTGLFTSLCNHTFHCSCIIKWDDTTCPVCRFHSFGASMDTQPSQANAVEDGNYGGIDGRGEGNDSAPTSETLCAVCLISDNLWICLICAHVGCGRYQKGHARTHFEETGHIYSLELVTQRVWDYKGDGYVHRIIQNTDGKLVHLPPPTTTQTPTRNSGRNGGDLLLHNSQPHERGVSQSLFLHRQPGLDVKSPNPVYTPTDVTVAHKLETVNQEYQELISSTLLQQKSYHQSQLESLELKSIDRFVHLEGIITLVQSENSVLKSECRRLTNALETSIRNADKIQTKYERSCKKVESLMQSLDEEREVSTRLLQNYQQLQASHAQIQDVTVKNLETKVDELQEQVRDLMFFLETREKVSSGEMRDEISGASVIGVVASSPPPAQSPSTPGRKGRKKK